MDINREKLIRHKVKRFLSSEEETIFEQLIQSDHSFSEAYQDHKDIHLMIKASEKEAIKQQLNQIEKHIQKRSVKKLWYSISGIAAVIVFCLPISKRIARGPLQSIFSNIPKYLSTSS